LVLVSPHTPIAPEIEMASTAFFPIVPAYHGPDLPACPDGSGDLWWDDASYAAYQAYDPIYEPEHLARYADSEGYCDGPRRSVFDMVSVSCPCHDPAVPVFPNDEAPF
jgi:hypothetical protein